MDALVCACAADEGGFLGVCGVGFGDCACCDEGGEEFSFDCLVLGAPAENFRLVSLQLSTQWERKPYSCIP